MSRTSTQFKMVLLGNSGAGKSSLVTRFVRDEYFDGVEATVGASFQSKVISLPDRVRRSAQRSRTAPTG
jgi:GTPase SAR1 family protein